jgi:glyoxylase-like metal-dependent hydrolase (beta-lactamase superfamily II)
MIVAAMLAVPVRAPAQAPVYAPTPASARGPQIPAKGYLVREIRDGLFWVTDGRYQTFFLVHDSGVIAVDAPLVMGERYLRAIAEVTGKPVTHVVYSHAHKDHIGAAHLFPDGAVYLAHRETLRALQSRADTTRPLPTVVFDSVHTLRAGGQTLELAYRGPNHEPGNIFIHAPRQRTLMLVDVVYPGWVPLPPLSFADDVRGYIAAHDQLLAYDFDTFVGGHLTRIGTRADVETARDYITDLRAASEAALAAVDFATVARASGTTDDWGVVRAWFGALTDDVHRRMMPRWRGRLGGADVYTRENAYLMIQFLRSVD